MSKSSDTRAARGRRTFLAPLLESSGGPWEIRNVTTGRVIASHVLTAFDSETRRTGLLKHQRLPEGHALVIAPCNAIHTFFMKFAIDVAFVARDGRVLGVRAAVAPWRLAASLRAHAVIELAAGTLQRSGTVCGDRLEVASSTPSS